MNENLDEEKLDRLFAARSARPDTSGLEQYFETRVMARIKEKNGKASWPVLAWRMVPVFITIVVILWAASLTLKPEETGDYFAAITNYEDDDVATF